MLGVIYILIEHPNSYHLYFMKLFSFFFFTLFVGVYLFAPDVVVVDQNKLDTLYMVSTIFFSAVIGMVISNSVHLHYVQNKDNLRKLNNKMRNVLTLCFTVETVAYFFFDNAHNHTSSGIHLHLIVLGLVVYSTFLYITAMPFISRKITEIENTDYEQLEESEQTAEVQDKVNRVLDFCQEPRTAEEIFKHIQLQETSDTLNLYIKNQIREKRLVEVYLGQHPAYSTRTFVTDQIICMCEEQECSISDITHELQISKNCANEIAQELVRMKRLEEVRTTSGKRYKTFDKSALYDSKQILGFCQKKAYTWRQILAMLNCPRTEDNRLKLIQPLIDGGLLIVESGTGDKQKLRHKDFVEQE